MSKEVLISYMGEDRENTLNISKNLSNSDIHTKIISSDPFAELPNCLGIILVLSKNYSSLPWFEALSQKKVTDTLNKTKLIILSFGQIIPAIFEGSYLVYSLNLDRCDTELSRISLYLQGHIKNHTNSPLSQTRNIM